MILLIKKSKRSVNFILIGINFDSSTTGTKKEIDLAEVIAVENALPQIPENLKKDKRRLVQ